jgi:hypothetical protein
MSTLEVGLGDSPARIAHRLTGDPRRYQELLASNPHKSLVYVGGLPTFASLGVGEPIIVPESWGLGANAASTPLSPGQTLQIGQTIRSPNGRAQLVLQTDGNLVLYDGQGHNALWASGTNGKPSHHAIMQTDGNFVLYDAQNRPLWASGTNGQSGAHLALQDDGNLVVYLGPSARWSSNTFGFQKHEEHHDPFSDFVNTVGNTVNEAGKLITSIPGVKEILKLQVDVDFAALSVLINTFVPSPASDVLHGLSNAASDEAKRAIDGLGPKLPKEIVDIILKELHFLGSSVDVVRYLVDRMLSTGRYDAPFFASLLAFAPPAGATPGEKALAEEARLHWEGDLDPALKQIIPPLTRLIGSLAATGKVQRSDLVSMLGGENQVIDKVLGMFGINDSPAAMQALAARAAANPALTKSITNLGLPTPPKKIIPLRTPPVVAPPKKTIAMKLPPAPAAPAVPAPQMPPAQPTPPPRPPPGPQVDHQPPGPPAALPPPGPPAVLPPPGPSGGAYGPYPHSGTLSAPPPHPGHHPGHPHGGGQPHQGGRWRGSYGHQWMYDPVPTTTMCSTWGDPIEMSPAMESVGQVQLRNSGGRPAAVRAADGVIYLFANEGGVLTMRPCAAVSSMLGDGPVFFYLYRKSGSGWLPVGDWMPVDQAEQQMTAQLTASPTAQLGAYIWGGGKDMSWKFF